MFQIKPIALAAALHGLDVAVAVATGCYPAWVGGKTYVEGDIVSRAKMTSDKTTERCVNCIGGLRAIKKKTHNYKCTQGGWCSQAAYDPIGPFSDQAWEKQMGECVVS